MVSFFVVIIGVIKGLISKIYLINLLIPPDCLASHTLGILIGFQETFYQMKKPEAFNGKGFGTIELVTYDVYYPKKVLIHPIREVPKGSRTTQQCKMTGYSVLKTSPFGLRSPPFGKVTVPERLWDNLLQMDQNLFDKINNLLG